MKLLPKSVLAHIALLTFVPTACLGGSPLPPGNAPSPTTAQSSSSANALELEAARLASTGRPSARDLSDWEAQRPELRRQLLEMLGLWPIPPREDLKPVVTGVVEHPDFTVEKVHFQALPQVYVTANLYLPRNLSAPAPAILYVCGHARVVTNGVSCGNKTAYQHHGIWFARNGYACLMIDTLQLGEIEGLHHGTYREGRWWWNSRGYTPAGVEAWFGIRALDYLSSRPEVDKERLGMTGRSGGGSYTWTVAALDDRVKVAVPVAGITDLHNQVIDGVVNGHCDCMFFVNTYQWDFGTLAALVAPRPLLFSNSDNDTIFPLDGVYRVHEQVKKIYRLYNKTDQLGLVITPGPHSDTQELQLPAFRWFNRYLKKDSSLVEMAAVPLFDPAQLRVFSSLPADQRNTAIDEFFVPERQLSPSSESPDHEHYAALLREKAFRAWPEEREHNPHQVSTLKDQGLTILTFSVPIQPGLELPLWAASKATNPREVVLHILDEATYTNAPAASLWTQGGSALPIADLQQELPHNHLAVVFFAPREVSNLQWQQDAKYRTSLRRKHMLLGQTIDSMRVFDIRCAIKALKTVAPEHDRVVLKASGPMAVNAAYAALFEPSVSRLELQNLPSSHREGPDYLNVLKVGDVADVLNLLKSRVNVQ